MLRLPWTRCWLDERLSRRSWQKRPHGTPRRSGMPISPYLYTLQGTTVSRFATRRALLVHQTALAAAGLAPPPWKPSVNGLFGKGIIDAMKVANNQSSDNKTAYDQAAKILETSKTAGGAISWDQLQIVFSALDSFVRDRKSNYAAFEDQYIASSTSKDTWADVRLRNLVRIFEYQNGPRSFQRAQEQHDPNAPRDYAESVVEDLLSGKLVIVDQSTGDPEQNRKAAERIMWGVFRAQQKRPSGWQRLRGRQEMITNIY